jgi:hypothetical protein
MAWSAPLTAIAGTALTAAQWNATVRDNLLETAPAKATSATAAYFVGNGTNSIVQRQISEANVGTAESTTSTSYTGLSGSGPNLGPLTTGTRAMVWIQAEQNNATANIETYTSFSVDGDTTSSSSDDHAMISNADAGQDTRACVCKLQTLTAGSNEFKMQYRVASGNGTWARRRIQVQPY